MEINILVGGPKEQLPDNFAQIVLSTKAPDVWVGADYGAVTLCRIGINPSLSIGDFDSSDNAEQFLVQIKSQKIISSRSEKDDTDTQLAVRLSNQYFPHASVIRIYGATGGRLDHLLSNIFFVLADEFKKIAPKIELIDRQNSVRFYLPGTYIIEKELDKKYLAFIPLTAVKSLTLVDEKYRLTKTDFNEPVSLASNEFMGATGTFGFSSGVVCVIQSTD
ncbi:thiamine diphosphokinase [Ligilactobacillus sp. WILCCON 0076]|uniref:Thiamine diphosphokinase n=1 Tax=Ligilactobacillus ubinensis TaxID=2876789 RepID=A0A9X2JLH8_9LACO|nr:thiamine diphosphokinase [Ligilactobacillus ubinensis]MCP0886993.1 thiamine diphosphokinase [Ligilactobacillus ubinensis]